MRKSIKVSNIDCANCAKTIETYFGDLEAVDAKVLVPAKRVIFEYDEVLYDEDKLADHLRIIGYYPILNNAEQEKAKRKDLIDLVLATILTIPLLWTMFVHLGVPIYVPAILMNGYVQWAIATPLLFYVGRRFFKATYHQLKNKNAGMDTLVVLGTLAAYIYSIYTTINYQAHAEHMGMPDLYFETTAVIIFMVLLGNYFENRVKEKTSDTLQSLISLSAKEARVLRNGAEVLIPVDQVLLGETMIVLANEKIALDGIVLKGKSYVDEAMITGEPMPSLKESGSKVIGSTMNTVETLTIKVTAVGSETVLANIIKTVEDTALIKPKAQRVADLIAKYFVPAVVIISILTFIIWLVWVNPGNFEAAFAPAIAVLVISCPCALGLATPTSISVGSGISFKEGILYKGGEFFEVANKINAIAFDKTGTLTKGQPEVSDFIGTEKSLKYAASLEKHSNHPIAKAILKRYKESLYEVNQFEVLIGQGIKGMIENKTVYVGSLNLVVSLGLNADQYPYAEHQRQGKTVFFTIVDSEVINMIAISDPLKPSAKKVIAELKRRDITPYMITGDQELTAKYIADELGIEHVFYEVLPHEKAQTIQAIQAQGKIVAFVGDGINDAPALKMADVGFAVGSGSDIAIDTSDVTLMSYDLNLVIKAIDLSLATLKNIYVNFFWAFIYNIVMIPFAALGFLNPSLAGIGMGFSSIMVVLNALSLKLFKFKEIKEV